jgi:putative ABC transport system permease protein
LVALFSSALPTLRFGVRDLSSILRAGGRGATSGRDRRRLQGVLVSLQVAFAFVLLAASTLMARTFVELREVRPGFEVDRQLTFRIALPSVTYPSDTSIVQLYDRLTTRLAALPGVRSVGLTSWLPLDKEGMSLSTAFPEGVEMTPGALPPAMPISFASPGYFESMGIPVVAGKTFRTLPTGQPSDEVIVSVALAKRSWGGEPASAVGRRMRFLPQGPWMNVVGVVGDVRQQVLEQEASPSVYLPITSLAYGGISTVQWAVGVVVRTPSGPETLAAGSRRVVAELDPAIPVYNLRTMREVMAHSMTRTSITALMLLVAAAVAMALGAIGLYGVVSYTVGMRTREIGLRLALGEPPSSVIGRFAGQGAVLAAIGVGAGLIGALLVTRVLRGLLYGVGPSDPLMLGVAAVLLVLTALVASWLPARRAARLDPATVLSAD